MEKANFIDKNQIKISIGIIVYNEEEYIEYCLKNIYDFSDEIIIAEGAVDLFVKANNLKHNSSSDKTVEIIKNFLDPQKKIKFIHKEKWENKGEMRKATYDIMTGTHYLLIDADEFYLKAELDLLKETVIKNLNIIWFAFPHLHFWKDFKTITVGNQWNTIHPRLCKRLPQFGYRDDHLYGHTTVYDFARKIFVIPHMKGYPTLDVPITIFHCGYVKKANNVLMKEKFYEKRRGTEDFTWHTWKSGQPTKNKGQAKSYNGLYPEILLNHPYMLSSPC